MTKYNLSEVLSMLKEGHKLKHISLVLGVSYNTLYDAIRQAGYRIKECKLDEIAIYSYRHGTKEACKRFGVTPHKLSIIRHNLRRKHGFKLTYAELGELPIDNSRRVVT